MICRHFALLGQSLLAIRLHRAITSSPSVFRMLLTCNGLYSHSLSLETTATYAYPTPSALLLGILQIVKRRWRCVREDTATFRRQSLLVTNTLAQHKYFYHYNYHCTPFRVVCQVINASVIRRCYAFSVMV